MGKRLERFGEVRIIDETNGFGLLFNVKGVSLYCMPVDAQTPEVLTFFCILPRCTDLYGRVSTLFDFRSDLEMQAWCQ